MQHHSESDGSLVVSSTSKFFDWLLLFGAGLCTVPTIRGAWNGVFDLNDSAPLIGSVFFLMGILVVFERTRFEFSPALRSVRWSRKRLRSRTGGSIPFDQIRTVVLQTSIGSSAVAPAYRIALTTDQGDLPLTTGYASGMQMEYEAIAAKIRTVLSLSPAPTDITMDSIRSAVEKGQIIEAVRLARLHKSLSLAEAKNFVEHLSQTSRS